MARTRAANGLAVFLTLLTSQAYAFDTQQKSNSPVHTALYLGVAILGGALGFTILLSCVGCVFERRHHRVGGDKDAPAPKHVAQAVPQMAAEQYPQQKQQAVWGQPAHQGGHDPYQAQQPYQVQPAVAAGGGGGGGGWSSAQANSKQSAWG